MAEIKISNIQAGQAATETLKQSTTKLQTISGTAKSGFNVLTSINPDMGSKFISELDGSLTDMISFLNKISSASAAYFKNDDGDGDDGGNRYGGNNYHNNGDEPVPTIITPTTEAPVEPDNDGNQIDGSLLEKMTLSQLDGFLGSMVSLAESKSKKLDELVADDKYADEVKKALLASPHLPDEFKKLITDIDSKVVLQFLESILKGQSPDIFSLNPLNLGIIFSYLETVAEKNGITVNELLTNPKYASLLRDTLSDFSNVYNMFKDYEEKKPEELQELLSNLYDGDVEKSVPDENIIVTRSFVDYISKESDIPYDELLSDNSYAPTLQKAVTEFSKALSFFTTSSKFTEKGMTNNVVQMFNGTNYKAFGMSDNNLSSFKAEIDALAKSNNTTTEKLLTDSSFADSIVSTLQKSTNAKGVGSIFKKENASYTQGVVKNLYNTEIKKDNTSNQYSSIASAVAEAVSSSIGGSSNTSSGTVKQTSTSVNSSTGEVTSTYVIE